MKNAGFSTRLEGVRLLFIFKIKINHYKYNHYKYNH